MAKQDKDLSKEEARAVKKAQKAERDAMRRALPRSVESWLNKVLDERGVDVPLDYLLHVGEIRRFSERRIRKGPFRGTVLPGFRGTVVDVRPWKKKWIFAVHVDNQGYRFAPMEELVIEENRAKKKRREQRQQQVSALAVEVDPGDLLALLSAR